MVNSSLAQVHLIEADYKQRGAEHDAYYWEQVGFWLTEADKAGNYVKLAVQWGLFAPIVLLLLSPVAWWIYRGFKPKEPSP